MSKYDRLTALDASFLHMERLELLAAGIEDSFADLAKVAREKAAR
ncbi:MAG: hypothetical protein ACT4OX_16405 [Actinomycetota bacterium]